MCYTYFICNRKNRHINTYQQPASDGLYVVDVDFTYNRPKVSLPDWAQVYMVSERPYGNKRSDYDR